MHACQAVVGAITWSRLDLGCKMCHSLGRHGFPLACLQPLLDLCRHLVLESDSGSVLHDYPMRLELPVLMIHHSLVNCEPSAGRHGARRDCKLLCRDEGDRVF